MKEIPFANSLTAVSAVLYVVCRVLAAVAPGFLVGLFQSWVHTIDVSSLTSRPSGFGEFIFGLVSLAVVTWVFGYAWAWFYNRLSK